MKLINEKGKLFGIINVVDLIIVVMVIAMVGAVATNMVASSPARICNTGNMDSAS